MMISDKILFLQQFVSLQYNRSMRNEVCPIEMYGFCDVTLLHFLSLLCTLLSMISSPSFFSQSSDAT